MYIVFIAGSIPTLKPLFSKRFFKLTNSAHHTGRSTRFHGCDDFKLTSLPMPPGRIKGRANTAGEYDNIEENSIEFVF